MAKKTTSSETKTPDKKETKIKDLKPKKDPKGGSFGQFGGTKPKFAK